MIRQGLSKDYNHYMVDAETTGLRADIHGITSIAFAQFDPDTFEVMRETHVALAIPPGRTFDRSTMEWRQKQGVNDRERDLYIISGVSTWLREMHEWLRPDVREPMLWAKPTHFDIAFLESYADMYVGGKRLTHYRCVRDLRSYIDGMGYNLSQIEGVVDHEGPAHDALADCKFQIACLHHAYKLAAIDNDRRKGQ